MLSCLIDQLIYLESSKDTVKKLQGQRTHKLEHINKPHCEIKQRHGNKLENEELICPYVFFT